MRWRVETGESRGRRLRNPIARLRVELDMVTLSRSHRPVHEARSAIGHASRRAVIVLAVGLASPSGAVAAQAAPIHLEPLAPIGCVTCDGAEAFGAVMGLSFLPDGGLAVVDRDEPMVRMFDADGAVETAFGRHGKGPGELSRPSGIAAGHTGRVVVSDFMSTGLTEYERSGDLVEVHPVPSTAMRLNADPSGRWMAGQIADWATMSGGVRVWSFETADSFAPLPTTRGLLLDEKGRAAAAGIFSSAVGMDGRIAVAHNATYRILLRDRDGRPLGEITRDVERTPRTAAEIAELESAMSRLPGGANNPEAGAARPEIDPLRPHLFGNALAYDATGRLWARTARGGPDRTIFDLFDAAGDYLGEVPLDLGISEFAVGHGYLAVVAADEATGVERIYRWRIGE